MIIPARKKHIGIPVQRLLPWSKKRQLGPFVFLDHMGPVVLKGGVDRLDVGVHPHIGLSTLTYLLQGSLLHRDSLGTVQEIRPGEVNWMIAGRGISHSERENESCRAVDRSFEGLQFWVALPKELEDCDPSFTHYKKSDLAFFRLGELDIELIAGEWHGYKSSVKTTSPTLLMLMRAGQQGQFEFKKREGEHGLYLLQGSVTIEGQFYQAGSLLLLDSTKSATVEHSSDAVMALMGGTPLAEERYIWWNMVSSSKEKIEQAREAWNQGQFPLVPGDSDIIAAPSI